MNKRFVILFALMLTAQVLFVVEPAFSSVATPSIPEFTVRLEAHPYDVPPTYSIDPYTGEKVIDEAGYHVENKSIVITIKNQDFTSSVDGTKQYMAYNVREKGHFEEEWNELYSLDECTMSWYGSEGFPKASNSDYTVLSLPAKKYPPGAKVDFQVQARIGYETQLHIIDYLEGHIIPIPTGEHDEEGIVFDRIGYWSNTQTITISESASTVDLNLPDHFTFILAGALILIPIAAGIGLLIHLSKKH